MDFDEKTEIILSNLIFFSTIQDNQKIYYYLGKKYLYKDNYEPYSLINKFYKYFASTKIENELESIKKEIEDAILILPGLKQQKVCYYNEFLKKFEEGMEGLINLKKTYDREGREFSTLLLIINNMKNTIEQLKE